METEEQIRVILEADEETVEAIGSDLVREEVRRIRDLAGEDSVH